MLSRGAPSLTEIALITAVSCTSSYPLYGHLPAHTHFTVLPQHLTTTLISTPVPTDLAHLAFRSAIALSSYHPTPTHDSSAPGRGLMLGGAGQPSSGGGRQGRGAAAVTAGPLWVAERSQAP